MTSPVWPSTFQFLEKPFYYLNEDRNQSLRLGEKPNFLKYMVIELPCWPIAMCGTIVSCGADIIAGVAESAFSVYQEDSSRVPSILHKKIIASPIQHFVFLICNLCMPIFLALMLSPMIFSLSPNNSSREKMITGLKILAVSSIIIGPVSGLFMYHVSQRVVGQLPKWASSEGFNIFINGGCDDPCGEKFTNPDYIERSFT